MLSSSGQEEGTRRENKPAKEAGICMCSSLDSKKGPAAQEGGAERDLDNQSAKTS